ncbi:MAG TPA: methylmalonyl-CoA mutase, partial [Bacteroidetes bacterium]|nr:methylmalonyl-CoA mutase [Bacteroidota bacterium]
LEYLTDAIEKEVNALMARIEEMGGSVRAIEQGFFQREIADSAYRAQKAIETKEQVIVGVNAFQIEAERENEILRVDPSVAVAQKRRLEEVRAKRNSAAVNEILGRITVAAKDNVNLMPLILEAVERYATLGEISDALRDCWGEYKGEN